MSQNILVKLDDYSGPLDLLLDLIKKNEVNIYDIPINFITQEYLDTLRQNADMGIEIQVEFLYLAATLLNIKTKMMLPSKDEGDDDPRVNLVEQLIVYNRFKMTQADLFALFDNNLLSYDKNLDEDVFNTNVVYTISYNKNNLFNTFESLINNKKQALESNEILIVKERYKTEDLVEDIKNILLKDNDVSLRKISNNKNREYLITAFLAILELLNSGLIVCKQESAFTDIYLSKI
ncbi:segregation and condensation protein A [Ezakiella peruensis]|uniref:segregation and condensation protein A n=1 Tax=Ezakiella peruensis TaxID=1464038 RepID=UPI000C1B2B1A|nr:segregation/condensation protein A [Ezakiella peruensis]